MGEIVAGLGVHIVGARLDQAKLRFLGVELRGVLEDAVLFGRLVAVLGEIEGGDEVDPALVALLVRGRKRVADAAFEHLADGLGRLGGSVEPVGRHGVGQEALVGEEIRDVPDLADVGEEIVGLALDGVGVGLHQHHAGAADIVLRHAGLDFRARGGVLAILREVEDGGESGVALVGELVGGALRIADAAFQHLADRDGVFRLGVEPERRHGIVEQPLVAHQVVDRLHVADMGEVVGGLAVGEVEVRVGDAEIDLQGVVLRHVGLGAVVAGGVAAEVGEVERLDERGVALVGQLVGETVGVGNALVQRLLHEGLGVVHVAEAEGLHGVFEQPVVVDELVDAGDLADIVEEILCLALDGGLGLHPVDRLRDVPRDELVTDIGVQHARISGSVLAPRIGAVPCAKLNPVRPPIQPRARQARYRVVSRMLGKDRPWAF